LDFVFSDISRAFKIVQTPSAQCVGKPNTGNSAFLLQTTKSTQKHKIGTETAEQVFHNRDVLAPLGIQIAPKVNEPRFCALGMDLSGRRLSVCFTIRGGKIRIISARPMSQMERKKYASLREE